MTLKTGYVVKFKVDGDPEGERTTVVYPDLRTAQGHADDIRGYDRVQYAIVVGFEEGKR